MKSTDELKKEALRQLQEEDEAKELERLKQTFRREGRTLLSRIIHTLRYKKPTIKWEYR